MTTIWFNLYSLSPEIYLLLSIAFLLIYGVLVTNSLSLGFPVLNQNLGWLSLLILVLTFWLVYSQPVIFLLTWFNLLISDVFAYSLKLIVLFSSILWTTVTLNYTSQHRLNSFEYWILVLLAVSSMLLVVQAFDFLSIYLTLEFQSLSFYILASFKRSSEFSTEAGLKYFILGAFSSALLLFGFSILYGFTGLTSLGDYMQLFYQLPNQPTNFNWSIHFGLLFVLCALLFKFSAAPFHMWSPDVYEGSPTSVTAFFSILPKIVILALLLRILIFSFPNLIEFWRVIILFCGIFSLFIGALSAFSQIKWKRFLSYSSVTHVGFFLMALLTGGAEGITNSIFYLVIYIVTIVGVFSFLISLRFFKYPNFYQSRYLTDLLNLGKTNSLLALSLTLLLFSTTGIPPLAGFFSKFFILFTTLQLHSFFTSAFLILVSSISCFYYIRLVKNMYFVYMDDWFWNYPLTKLVSLSLGLSVLFTLFFLIDLENLRYFVSTLSIN